jgi:transcriptional regulator with XRE-family HTH domain
MKQASFKKIGKYFRQKRLDRKMTQEEIARFLGYTSKQIISNWERGLCSPPLDKVASLIALLSLDSKEVLQLFVELTREELSKSFKTQNARVKGKRAS